MVLGVGPAVSPNHRLVGGNKPDNAPEGTMQFSREPALLWISFIAPGVALLAAFVFKASPDLQGVINAAAVAIAAGVTAYLVHAEDAVAIITGAAQAVLAVVLAFGVHMDSAQQASIMAFVGLVVGAWVRTQVTAPVPVAVVSA